MFLWLLLWFVKMTDFLFQYEMQSGAGTKSRKNQDTVLNVTSGILHFLGDSLVPNTIDRNCLGGAKVLQQVDKKFIPIVVSSQHNTWYNWSGLFCPFHSWPFLVSHEFPYNKFTLTIDFLRDRLVRLVANINLSINFCIISTKFVGCLRKSSISIRKNKLNITDVAFDWWYLTVHY